MDKQPPLVLDSQEIFEIIKKEKTLKDSYISIVNSSFEVDVCLTKEHKVTIHKILVQLSKLLESANIKHWIDWGTFLGAYRDNSIIPWDKDFDLGMLSKDKKAFYEILKQVSNLYIKEEESHFLNFSSKEIPEGWLDIYFYDKTEDEDGTYIQAPHSNARDYKHYENLDSIKFSDLSDLIMPCPSLQSAPQLLSFLYGKDFMNPPGNPLVDNKGMLWVKNLGGR